MNTLRSIDGFSSDKKIINSSSVVKKNNYSDIWRQLEDLKIENNPIVSSYNMQFIDSYDLSSNENYKSNEKSNIFSYKPRRRNLNKINDKHPIKNVVQYENPDDFIDNKKRKIVPDIMETLINAIDYKGKEFKNLSPCFKRMKDEVHKEIVRSTSKENSPLMRKRDEQLVNDWWKSRGGKPDTPHICTWSTCADKKNIHVIDEQRSLYGCIQSGEVHKCVIGDCNRSYITGNGTTICIFSSMEAGHEIVSTFNGKSGLGEDRSDGISEFPESNVDDMSDNDAEFDYAEEAKISIIEKPKKMNILSIHIPSHLNDYTRETKEFDFNKRKKERSKAINKKHGEMINDTSRLNSEARAIIYDLLYNREERNKIDLEKEREINIQYKTSVRKYYKSRSRSNELLSIRDLDSIKRACFSSKKRISIIDHDEVKIQYYVSIISEFWRFIHLSEREKEIDAKVHISYHVLAVLYMLEEGFNIDILVGQKARTLQFKPDSYLKENIISISDLVSITPSKATKYSKKDITRGTKYINSALSTSTIEMKKIFALKLRSIIRDSVNNKNQINGIVIKKNKN